MSKRLSIVAVVALCLGLSLAGCTPFSPMPGADRLEIIEVKVIPGRPLDFVVIQVTLDYRLVSKTEGLVVMELDLNQPGVFEPVAENYVDHPAGTIRLMAQCKRPASGRHKLQVDLAEFPRAASLVRLASEARSVSLP